MAKASKASGKVTAESGGKRAYQVAEPRVRTELSEQYVVVLRKIGAPVPASKRAAG